MKNLSASPQPFDDSQILFDTPRSLYHRMGGPVWGSTERGNFFMGPEQIDDLQADLKSGYLQRNHPQFWKNSSLNRNVCDYLIADPELAEIIADRFTLLGVVGYGGLSQIFGALDRQQNRFVVLKTVDFLQQNSSARSLPVPDEIKIRFFRSVYILSLCCDHPNLIQSADFSTVTDNSGALSLEWSGVSVRQIFERRGREVPVFAPSGSFSLHQVALQVGMALDHLGKKGIVHRDIKPANILFHQGNAVLADFGVSQFASVPGGHPAYDWFFDPESEYFTQENVQGTPCYLPPEAIQALVERTDYVPTPEADLYAYGVLLYELLMGKVPFSFSSKEAVVQECERVLNQNPERIRATRADVPPALESLILLLLSKDPKKRPPLGVVLSTLSNLRSAA